MKKNLFALLTFVLGGCLSAQAVAHHSFAAEFDSEQIVELDGIVTRVDWANPHTYIYIETDNGRGGYEQWALEMGSPNSLLRRGWTHETLAIGEGIRVRGTLARDGSNKTNAQVVMIAATCQRLFAGTSQRDYDEASDKTQDCKL